MYKTFNEIVDEVTAEYRSIFGDDIIVTPTSPAGLHINITAQIIYNFELQKQSEQANQNAQLSTGSRLDGLAWLNGITRKAGLKTSVIVEFTGIENTVIPLGTELRGGELPVITTATGVIGSSGVLSLPAECIEYGEVTYPKNVINSLSTAIIGVNSVTNPSEQEVVGFKRETDTELRLRIFTKLEAKGGASIGSVEFGLADHCSKVRIYDANIDDTLDFGTLEAVVVGAKQEFAKSLQSLKPAGIVTVGTTSETIDNVDVYYSPTTSINTVYVILKIQPTALAESGAIESVKAQVKDIINAVDIGGRISVSELLSVLNAKNLFISDVFWGLTPNPSSSVPLVNAKYEYFDVQEVRIDV